MKPHEIFTEIKQTTHRVFKEAGDCVNYMIRTIIEEKTIYLMFEESDGKRDWQVNFNFPVKPYKKQESVLYAATGWSNAYKSCNDEIQADVKKACDMFPDFKVVITGWSYGGAMAVLAAEDFYFRNKRKPELITFGAPKVLFGEKSKQYVAACCEPILQYANYNDIVSYLPPFPFYTHLEKVSIGEAFNPIKLLNPKKYHTNYDDLNIYPR